MQEITSSPSLTAAPVGAAEGEVINQNVYGAVRTLAEQGAPKKAIARQLGLDVKTVRKWVKRSWAPQRRRARGRSLDRWREFLQARAPEVGFNAVVLTREMAALGYGGGYSAVLKYIAPWRQDWRGEGPPTTRLETRARGLGHGGGSSAVSKYTAPGRKDWRGEGLPTTRFETGPGEQAQVDWGSTALCLGDVRTRGHLFTMVLGRRQRIVPPAY